MSHHFLKGSCHGEELGFVYCVTWAAGIGAGNLKGHLLDPDAWTVLSASAHVHELLDSFICPDCAKTYWPISRTWFYQGEA